MNCMHFNKVLKISLMLAVTMFWSCEKTKVLSEENPTYTSTLESLNLQKAEILKLSKMNETCDSTADWTVIGIGAKACGGPTEYIVYHNSINENDFLQKVENYKQNMMNYNQKNEIVSDCMMKSPPEIACRDGKISFVQ